MTFNAEQVRAVNKQLREHRDVEPPRAVLIAVAALMGEDKSSALICESESDDISTTWRVVCLLDSDCLFTVMAVGNDNHWDFESLYDRNGQVQVELSTQFRSLSDVASLRLTRAEGFGSLGNHTPWDVTTAWEVCWRDGSPALALPAPANPLRGEQAATEAIVNKIRQVLATR